MEKLYIPKTDRSLEVIFDAKTQEFSIKGYSIPDDTFVFFQPINAWIDAYFEEEGKEFTLQIQLDYHNTSSSMAILTLIKKLTDYHTKGIGKVAILWYYDKDDDYMMDCGEDFRSLSGLSDQEFQLIATHIPI